MQTPSQRVSNRLDMLLERRLAFIDNETRISTLWKRVPLPPRPGTFPVREVPKGHVMRADRNTRMWTRLEQDADYRALLQRIWMISSGGPPPLSADTTPEASAPTGRTPTAATAYPGLADVVDKVAAEVAVDVQ